MSAKMHGEKSVEVRISDTGSGISKDQVENLFHKYWQDRQTPMWEPDWDSTFATELEKLTRYDGYGLASQKRA